MGERRLCKPEVAGSIPVVSSPAKRSSKKTPPGQLTIRKPSNIILSAAAAAAAAAATSWYSVRKLSQSSKPLSRPAEEVAQTEPSKVALIVNPSKSGGDDAEEAVARVCAEAGMEAPLVFHTTPENAGQDAARKALDAGCDTIVAAGGDGSVNEWEK